MWPGHGKEEGTGQLHQNDQPFARVNMVNKTPRAAGYTLTGKQRARNVTHTVGLAPTQVVAKVLVRWVADKAAVERRRV
jgi:hypothetical protein